jgi:hypothetical protein
MNPEDAVWAAGLGGEDFHKLDQEIKFLCSRCGACIGSENAYCGPCGAKNSHFNEERFNREYGSLQKRQEENCLKGKHVRSLDNEYCLDCGQ